MWLQIKQPEFDILTKGAAWQTEAKGKNYLVDTAIDASGNTIAKQECDNGKVTYYKAI